MTGHAYWRRVLDRVSDPETIVVLGFTDEAGSERSYRGRVARTDSARGPLIEVAGELIRLCPWERVRSVECLSKNDATVSAEEMIARLEARDRAEDAADIADSKVPF